MDSVGRMKTTGGGEEVDRGYSAGSIPPPSRTTGEGYSAGSIPPGDTTDGRRPSLFFFFSSASRTGEGRLYFFSCSDTMWKNNLGF